MSSVTELDHVSVRERTAEMGCPMPEIAIMPHNFAAARSHRELKVRREEIALRGVLENASFPLGSFCDAAEHVTFGEEDLQHWEASLFVSAQLMRREPYVVSIALSIVRDHLKDYFAAQSGRTMRFSLIVEKIDGTCRKLTYEGDTAGLRSLDKLAREIASE